MSNQLRWGFIGCGNVTEKKSGPAYQKADGFEVVAVFRRDLAKAEDYANRHKIGRVHQTAEALVNDPQIDAVYVATPPDSHLQYALQIAAAGKICCIEKPLAPTYAEAQKIHAAFAAKELPLFVAYYRRSLPRFLQVKQWLDEGKIGRPRHVQWLLSRPAKDIDKSRQYNWRTDKKIAPGGYFDDLACHGLDLLNYYFGEVEKANGICCNQLGLYSAFDSITANWLYANGVSAAGCWNFGSDKHRDRVEIIGDKGCIEFSVFQEQPLKLHCGEVSIETRIDHPENIQRYHVENIFQHLFLNKMHPSTGETAVATAWLMQQILSD